APRPPARTVPHTHQSSAPPLAAASETLCEPQEHQRNGSPRTQPCVGRQQTDAECGDAHDHQRQNEHGFSTDFVAIVPDDDSPDRASDEPHTVSAKRRQRPCERVEGWKGHGVEYKSGGSAVEIEVVPLDGRTNKAG